MEGEGPQRGWAKRKGSTTKRTLFLKHARQRLFEPRQLFRGVFLQLQGGRNVLRRGEGAVAVGEPQWACLEAENHMLARSYHQCTVEGDAAHARLAVGHGLLVLVTIPHSPGQLPRCQSLRGKPVVDVGEPAPHVRVGRSVRKTTRRGQDKLAEIQNIVQETITGNGIVKAFGSSTGGVVALGN